MHRWCTNKYYLIFRTLCALVSWRRYWSQSSSRPRTTTVYFNLGGGAGLGSSISLTTQIDPELVVVLHQPPKFWEDKHGPSCLAFVCHYDVTNNILDLLSLPPKHKMRTLAKSVCFCLPLDPLLPIFYCVVFFLFLDTGSHLTMADFKLPI